MTGAVKVAALRRNTFTNREFQWARVATLGGEYEVVVDPADLPKALAPGNVIQGTFWMVGRLRPDTLLA
jgi:hypothetical protein